MAWKWREIYNIWSKVCGQMTVTASWGSSPICCYSVVGMQLYRMTLNALTWRWIGSVPVLFFFFFSQKIFPHLMFWRWLWKPWFATEFPKRVQLEFEDHLIIFSLMWALMLCGWLRRPSWMKPHSSPYRLIRSSMYLQWNSSCVSWRGSGS